MDDSVQFATTADGVRIAYCTAGRGNAVIYMPPIPLRHVVRKLSLPEDKRWLDRLGRARLTVTKRIKDAIERIRATDPSLARHFAATIKTAHLCAYHPDPDRPVLCVF